VPVAVGHVEAIFRYPVKSMRGESLDAAVLGWHGLDGDRRLAFRRRDVRSGFPWLTASRLPELIRFAPERREGEALPSHVVTPEGEALPLFGEALAAEIERRHGAPVEMTHLTHGIFDEASVSLITSDTVREIARLAETSADVRRFRPNILVAATRGVPFAEDEWVGRVLAFGSAEDAPAVAVTTRDPRWSMVILDPEFVGPKPELLKTVARANQSNAGVYATVMRSGRVAVGQPVVLHR